MNLKELNLYPLTSWSVSTRIITLIAIFIFTLIVGSLFLIKPRLTILHLSEKQYQSLQSQYKEQYKQVSFFPQYKEQLSQRQKTLYRVNLPLSNPFTQTIKTISDLATKNHLEIHSLKPEPENIHPFYVSQPISLSLSGDYGHLFLFVTELSALQKTIAFENFTITTLNRKANEGAGSTLLMMNATVSSLRGSS